MPSLLLVDPAEAALFFAARAEQICSMAPDLPIDALVEVERLRLGETLLLRADGDPAAVIVEFLGGGLAIRHIFRFGRAHAFMRRYWPALLTLARDSECEFVYTRARNRAVARTLQALGFEKVGCGHYGVLT